MALSLKKVTYGPLDNVHASAPSGAIIGVIGEDDAGVSELMSLAAGVAKPTSGSVTAGKIRRLIGVRDPLDLSPADVIVLDQALALRDALTRARTAAQLDQMRRAGSTVLIASHDEELLERLCDEVWWLNQGKLQHRGDPRVVLAAWRKHIADQMRQWGESLPQALASHLGRGDGRAEIVRVETFGENGVPSRVWRSGEHVMVRIAVTFTGTVDKPVVGILLRNRIGLDVYGTNTELERLSVGPAKAGDVLKISVQFRCDLCAQEYTLTVASLDPDGTRHDWIDDAVSIIVTDSRHTLGVANLRAKMMVST